MKKLIIPVVSAALLLQAVPVTASATKDVAGPTEKQIVNYIKSKPLQMSVAQTYVKKPTTTIVGQTNTTAALNTTNFVRYLTNLPAVSENKVYSELAQNGAWIMNKNNQLAHSQDVPKGLQADDSRYLKGDFATQGSNIAWGYVNIAQSILYGYMFDEDSGNIASVGHRKWILDPTQRQVGFGQVNRYSAMYVFDNPANIEYEFSDDYVLDSKEELPIKENQLVAWPAATMPIQYMDKTMPFSLSYNEDAYDLSEAVVTMLNTRTKKKIVIDAQSVKAGQHFSLSSSGYGNNAAIVWRAATKDMSYQAGDTYKITIDNVYSSEEGLTDIQYDVKLFDLQTILPEIVLPKKIEVEEGKTFKLDFAKKYDYSSDTVGTVKRVTKNDSTANVVQMSNTSKNMVYKATKPGKDTLQVTFNGHVTSIPVTVKAKKYAVTSVQVTKNIVTLKKGKYGQIQASVLPKKATIKTLTYKSSNTKIVTVSKTGKILGKQKGTAYVTVKSSNGKMKKVKVTIH